MEEPVLVVMAAGMGSRFGGLKQIEPIDEEGNKILDFSLYDAKQAGFKKVIFIIKKEIEHDFKSALSERIKEQLEISYAYQEITNLPQGYLLPAKRTKPWGTGHAVLSCESLVHGPFAVINADDFYGRNAFIKIYQFLKNAEDTLPYSFAMAGYVLKNTITENGFVARGICQTENGFLKGITERTKIKQYQGSICYFDEVSDKPLRLSEDSIVSMNLWGFTQPMMNELKNGFPDFLAARLLAAPNDCEYFLPSVVDRLIQQKKAQVAVLKSEDKWYGVTYPEDKQTVTIAVKEMKEKGIYPKILWK